MLFKKNYNKENVGHWKGLQRNNVLQNSKKIDQLLETFTNTQRHDLTSLIYFHKEG
jgi:hypothetical protein